MHQVDDFVVSSKYFIVIPILLPCIFRLITVKEKTENDFSNLLLHLSGGSFLIEMTLNPLGSKNYGPYKYAAIRSLIKLLTVLL